MTFWLLRHILSLFLDLFSLFGASNNNKDLEIIILRQQVRILQRKAKSPPRISTSEKILLGTIASKLIQSATYTRNRLNNILLLFKPDTVLGWHRKLVRRKWTYLRKGKPGRPRLSTEIEALIIQFARENPRWGYDKIHGELLKLGFAVSPTSIRNTLKRHQISPVSERSSLTWKSFLNHYKDQILACDFFTIETIRLQTIYVLFFIELGTKRIHFAGCTAKPNATWVTQQARHLIWDLDDTTQSFRFLIHDHDTKFSSPFDNVFISEGIKIIHTPFQAHKANSFAERWVRSVREECLDHILIINQNHLRSVLKEFVDYYNLHRPHQGINQQFPKSGPIRSRNGPIRRRNIVGGIIHDYYRQPFSST
jgi:hypothetical protein